VSVTLTIRDVPEHVRDALAARGAREGVALQEHLLRVLVALATRRSGDDVIARARARVAAAGTRVDAASILAARDADRR
jgi:hypothetical protein